MTPPKIYARNSTLWIRFSLNKKSIKKTLSLKDTKANRKLAETKIIPQLILNIHNGEFFKKQDVKKMPTVDEYVKVSFKLHRGNRCKESQYGYERNYEKHIKPVFGNKKLDTITPNQITFWQNDLQEKEKLSKATIKKIRTTIYRLFEDAIEEDIVSFNPVTKAKNIKNTEVTKLKRIKLTPFKKDEIKALLEAVEGSERNLLATFFYTGMRAGECIGLKWEYVDLEAKTISVREQIINGKVKEVLKTTNSNRTIPIIKALIPYLEEQYKLTGHLNSYVFLTQRSNKHFHSANKVREQIWNKAIKKADVPYRNLHQTRGTFISTLISNGEDINYVSKIAGHQNVRITLERYSEYIPIRNENFGKCFI